MVHAWEYRYADPSIAKTSHSRPKTVVHVCSAATLCVLEQPCVCACVYVCSAATLHVYVCVCVLQQPCQRFICERIVSGSLISPDVRVLAPHIVVYQGKGGVILKLPDAYVLLPKIIVYETQKSSY